MTRYGDLHPATMVPPRGTPDPPPEADLEPEWEEPLRDPEAEADEDYHYRTEGT